MNLENMIIKGDPISGQTKIESPRDNEKLMNDITNYDNKGANN
jgi:hypothetical protein